MDLNVEADLEHGVIRVFRNGQIIKELNAQNMTLAEYQETISKIPSMV